MGRLAVCNSVLSGEKLPLSGSGDLTRNTPDQPVLVSLILMSGPQVPTKSYFTARPSFPIYQGN